MPASKYRFAGDLLAQAASPWDVQHQNCGMLELSIDTFAPGGSAVLILSVADFSIPGRAVGTDVLPYINGNNKYKTRPEPLGNITATFRDFPLTGTRAFLHEWFRSSSFDEETGLMVPESIGKTSGYLVLFGSNGSNERYARLEGLMCLNEPDTAVNFGSGEAMLMQVNISVDRIIWEPSLFAVIGAAAGAVGSAALAR